MNNYYLQIDNDWDAYRTAQTEHDAVHSLFPNADIDFVGYEEDSKVFSVRTSDGRVASVEVEDRGAVYAETINWLDGVIARGRN